MKQLAVVTCIIIVTTVVLLSLPAQYSPILKKGNGKEIIQQQQVHKIDTVSQLKTAFYKLQHEKKNTNMILLFSGIIILLLVYLIWKAKKKNKKMLQTNISLAKQFQEMRRQKNNLENRK
jgi:hypothetical protein